MHARAKMKGFEADSHKIFFMFSSIDINVLRLIKVL